MAPRALLVALGLWPAVALAAPARDCQALYRGLDGPRDLPAALACFRADKEWAMVAVMLLNGEGGPADLAGARAAYQHLLDDESQHPDADAEALGKILRRREAHPRAAGRIDYCRDVAQTTLSMNVCQSLEDRADEDRARTLVARTRAPLAPPQQALLDELATAAAAFIEADGQRLYQQYIDGSIRNLAALGQQRAVRHHFVVRLEAWGAPAATPTARRSFDAADRELNAVYQQTLPAPADGGATELTKKIREAQRAWLRYREAFARFGSALQPPASTNAVQRTIRAAITEDRIGELKSDPVAPP